MGKNGVIFCVLKCVHREDFFTVKVFVYCFDIELGYKSC